MAFIDNLTDTVMILENNDRKSVKCSFENGCMIYKGEEFFESFTGDEDGFEWVLSLDSANTEKLLLVLDKIFGKDMYLKDVFVDVLNMGASYGKLTEYCKENNIEYSFWSR